MHVKDIIEAGQRNMLENIFKCLKISLVGKNELHKQTNETMTHLICKCCRKHAHKLPFCYQSPRLNPIHVT